MNSDHSYSVLSGNVEANGSRFSGWNQFDDIIKQFLREQDIPGAAVAISRSGDIIYKQGYGVAGCSRRVLPDSVFRIASISKPITAAVVLHVCQNAGISLDAPVFGKKGILKKYRVQDRRAKKISIRHLLQHSAGWDRDKVGDAVFVRPKCVIEQHPDSNDFNVALLSYSLRRKLQFTPGTWHSYSNLGYLALGQVVQSITGSDFSHVLQEFLANLEIDGISVGQRGRTQWGDLEVEYFHNKEPSVVESLYPGEGFVQPQYGGMAMPSSASYGGLIANTASLLRFMHCMELAVRDCPISNENQDKDAGKSTYDEKKDGTWKVNEKNRAADRVTEKQHIENALLNGFETFPSGDSVLHLDKDLGTPAVFILSEALPFISEETVSIPDLNSSSVVADILVGNMHPSSLTVVTRHQNSQNMDESPDVKLLPYVSNHPELKRHQSRPLMSATQAKNSLACPTYENESAVSWYGLGWDVELCGGSWGHTGGMEGTCGTLRHHEPWGISWAFLLNSWAPDCDLDGVIKSGIMMTMGQALPEQGLCDLLEKTGHFGIKVRSKDGEQVVLVNVTQAEIMEELPKLKDRGFFVTWLSCISQNLMYDADGTKQTSHRENSQNKNCGSFPSPCNYKGLNVKNYCVILTNSGCPFKDFIVVFDKSLQQLKTLIAEFEQKAFFLNFLDSFCAGNVLRYMAVFRQDFHPRTSNCHFSDALDIHYQTTHNVVKPEHLMSPIEESLSVMKDGAFCETCARKPKVYLAMTATDYVRKIRTLIESQRIVVQSVTEVGQELWVSVVLRSVCKSQNYSVAVHKGKTSEKWYDVDCPESKRLKNMNSKSKCYEFHDHNQKNSETLCLDSHRNANYNPSDHHLFSHQSSKQINHSSFVNEHTNRTSSDTIKANKSEDKDQVNQAQGATIILTKPQHSSVSSNRKSLRLRAQNSQRSANISKVVQSVSNKKKTPKQNSSLSQTSNDSVYWVQITPESFLTELNRQIQKDRSLQYCKFYTVSGKPYVSAVWQQTACHTKITSKSKCVPTGCSGSSKEFENRLSGSNLVPDFCHNTDLPHFDQATINTSRYHRTALSKYGLLPELAEAAWSNHSLQSLSEYKEEDGSVYYAALWLP